MENLKEILRDENCLGMIIKDTYTHRYAYQPTNDMGFWFDYVCDDFDVYVDKVERFKQGPSKYVIMVEEDTTVEQMQYDTLEDLWKGEELIK